MALERKLRLVGVSVRVLGAPKGGPLRTRAKGEPGVAPALVAFVRDSKDLAKREAAVVASARADRVTWVAYPKGGQLGTDLNRDRT
jgi:hypothetical protein